MPYILATIGIIILVASISLLIAPFFNWQKYQAAKTPVIMDISTAGRYSFFVICYRSWSSYGSNRKITFSIAICDVLRKGEFVSAHNMTVTTSTGVGFDVVRVGLFNAPYPGRFTIHNMPDSHYGERDKIIIRRYVSKVRQILLILCLVLSPHMITSGLAGGLVSFGGLIVGSIILALNW
ncbi:MAG: hypothetical protein FWC73_04250 [Defluviitaleaceae bacterium]|nr:hypothetical protein [Defluviitaleaceae bacterium]